MAEVSEGPGDLRGKLRLFLGFYKQCLRLYQWWRILGGDGPCQTILKIISAGSWRQVGFNYSEYEEHLVVVPGSGPSWAGGRTSRGANRRQVLPQS